MDDNYAEALQKESDAYGEAIYLMKWSCLYLLLSIAIDIIAIICTLTDRFEASIGLFLLSIFCSFKADRLKHQADDIIEPYEH